MKLCSKILAIAVVAAITVSLIGCAGPSATSYQNQAITMTATCSDCPIGIIFAPTNNLGQAVPQPASNAPPTTSPFAYPFASTAIPPGAIMLVDNQGEGGTILLTATVNGQPATDMTWTVYPTPVSPAEPAPYPTGGSAPIGENTSPYGQFFVESLNTGTYGWNPAGSSFTPIGSVPYYTGTALEEANAMNIPQGDVLLYATAANPTDPGDPSDQLSYGLLVQIYNQSSSDGPPSAFLVPRTPTNPSGLTTSVATVTRNTTFQFYGGIIGVEPCYTPTACAALNQPYLYTDNTSIWEIGTSTTNGVVCSKLAGMTAAQCPEGWIDQVSGTPYNAIYTAPANVPSTQPVITVVSHANSSVSAYAYITVD
jgi:hypothetical protein